MSDLAKVFFQLQPDEDGWPPVSVESVWARPGTCENEYILENVPFFTHDATIEDTVQVSKQDDVLWFKKVKEASDNSLIRVIVTDLGAIEEIQSHLASLGCTTEISRNFKLIAVSIPASIRLADVQDYLQAQASEGKLDYEEAILRE